MYRVIENTTDEHGEPVINPLSEWEDEITARRWARDVQERTGRLMHVQVQDKEDWVTLTDAIT